MSLSNHELITIARKRNIPLDDVVPKDMLNDIPFKRNLIINLQDLYNDDGTMGGGTHWVCLTYNKKSNRFIYFDSYGLQPPLEVLWFCFKHKPKAKLEYANEMIQRIVTTLCGYYCLTFLKYCQIYSYLTPSKIIEKFYTHFDNDRDKEISSDELMYANRNMKKLLKKIT